MNRVRSFSVVATIALASFPSTAFADDPPQPTEPPPSAASAAAVNAADPTTPPADPKAVKVVVATLPGNVKLTPAFQVDPLGDTAIIAGSLGFAGLLDFIMGTGEVQPQQISSTYDVKRLLGIDRGAVSQHVDSNAGTFSNFGMIAALSYAVIDPVMTMFREKDAMPGIVDGVLYAETLSITMAMTNLAKVAVRRPRPLAYVAAQEHKGDPNWSNSDTDSSLSFFSGHTSTVAAVSATATYLAFARSPKSVRPWITLLAGTALTTFVGIERVRAGKHFPTDVIAGAMAGAGIGLVVPHLHRADPDRQRTYWIGAAPMNTEKSMGGMLTLSGFF